MLNIQQVWSLSYYDHFKPYKGHLRGKSMFMNCIGTFDSIAGRKVYENVVWELICELCVSYEFYKWTIESYQLKGI